jgi:predicted CopG family antitoxin
VSKYNVDQTHIGIKHATYAKLRAIKQEERTTFDEVLNMLIEKKGNAVVTSNSEDVSPTGSERESYNGKI